MYNIISEPKLYPWKKLMNAQNENEVVECGYKKMRRSQLGW